MNISTKLLQAAAGSAGGAGLDVDQVFSTFLYDGNATAKSINNGIDLSGEGGLVWTKRRSDSYDHQLYDTARGADKALESNDTSVEHSGGLGVIAFNSNGFNLGTGSRANANGHEFVSWTFRKAPKFFDVVTYTGDGTNNRQIAHNLGCQFGMLIVKCTSHTNQWIVWHRSTGNGKYLVLNETNAQDDDLYNFFGSDNTTNGSTHFSVSSNTRANESGKTYVAYIFAHNNNDGEFGPDSDKDIIKCGSYTGNGSSTGPTVNLGFEPQFVMIKNSSSTQNWWVLDNMRGIVSGGADIRLKWNTNDSEDSTGDVISLTPTGFDVTTSSSSTNTNGDTYIYMAIRRGPLAAPTDATDVFATGVVQNNTGRTLTNPLGHPSDWAFLQTSSGGNWIVQSRLTGSADLKFNSTAAEVNNKGYGFANNTNYEADGTAAIGAYGWNFRRAPSYFDVVAYKGNAQSSAITVDHNLGVIPEMMWCKKRGATGDWMVYHKDLNGGTNPHTYRLRLNSTGGEGVGSGVWNAAPTATQFSVGTDSDVNADANIGFITYLFATAPGVSKVGSYTGNGSSQNIDCGFSSGAKFVIIKRTDSADDWIVVDTERGIVAGNDPYLALNTTDPQLTSQDYVDPYSAGFAVTGENPVGASGGSYIFYAIA